MKKKIDNKPVKAKIDPKEIYLDNIYKAVKLLHDNCSQIDCPNCPLWIGVCYLEISPNPDFWDIKKPTKEDNTVFKPDAMEEAYYGNYTYTD